MKTRRKFSVTVASIIAGVIVCGSGLVFAAAKLWECNNCHQQYQGDFPPRFDKCPATGNKQNHFWIQK